MIDKDRNEWLNYNFSIAYAVRDLNVIGFRSMVITGSRVICWPAPTDTDLDIVVMVEPSEFGVAVEFLKSTGWALPPTREGYPEPTLGSMATLRKVIAETEVNLILVNSYSTFTRWRTATYVASKLNLTEKNDRVLLFSSMLNIESFQGQPTYSAYAIGNVIDCNIVERDAGEVCAGASYMDTDANQVLDAATPCPSASHPMHRMILDQAPRLSGVEHIHQTD